MQKAIYLTEEFYKEVHKGLVKNAGDCELLQQRTSIMEEARRDKAFRDEENYEILETFGVIL